ncbi:hypothetical protein [uncultured Ruminococcus sp.]|uniref:hypothetical protein n=1 Tax=uncultured Ruminococcus sp. TaxID=165186 RepID=UPI00292FB462|nr:hypothetical protein [uncultured Ruminococcus sp.]
MKKRIIACALTVVMVLTMAFSFSACAKDMTVTITDSTAVYTVIGKDNMNVQQFIDMAQIKLNPRDVVTPSLETVFKENEDHAITIQRMVRVKVTDGTSPKDVDVALGGTVADAIAKAGFDAAHFVPDVDASTPLTDGMTITLTDAQADGFVTDATGRHYYKGGVMQTSTVVGDETEGYFYVNEQGVVDEGYVDGVNVDGVDWIVINGKATQVLTDSDGALFSAAKDIAKCTNSSMTKEEKLKAAFDYIRQNYLEGVPHDPPYRESDWPVVCANDLFVYGKGDCFSYGAAFAYMCKAIGCTDVYACNSGGHGWAEAEGKMYDPEWSMHSDKYSYFAVGPDDEVDVAYFTTVNDAEWKHKAIELNQQFQ